MAIARQRARKLKPYVGSNDCVFEYGVGTGFNLAALTCGERFGYDVYDGSRDLARWGIHFFGSTADLGSAQFDVCLCMHTLEHVAQPWTVLEEMRRLLKPRGRLIACVPFEVGSSYCRFERDNIHQHLYSWNVQTLGMLLTKAGFDLQEIGIRKFGYDRFAAKITRGTEQDLVYRAVHTILLWIRPHYEIMAICSRS